MREFGRDFVALGLPSAPQHLITVSDDPYRPQPRLDRDNEDGMTTTVGRVREDAGARRRQVRAGVAQHAMGAAKGAMLIAEYLVHAGLHRHPGGIENVPISVSRSHHNGGGGIRAHGGTLLLERCRIEHNSGRKAAAVLIDGWAKVTMRDCLVAGNSGTKPAMQSPAVMVHGGGGLVLEHSTIRQDRGPALLVSSDALTAPKITIDNCILGELTIEAPGPDPKVVVRQTAMLRVPTGIEDGGGNLIGEFSVDANGRPAPHSPASGRGPR